MRAYFAMRSGNPMFRFMSEMFEEEGEEGSYYYDSYEEEDEEDEEDEYYYYQRHSSSSQQRNQDERHRESEARREMDEKSAMMLGIDVNANATAIKTAYRELARMYHPDKWTEHLQMSRAEGKYFLLLWCVFLYQLLPAVV
tara:strand:- start:177 stop:599 length:423 start_codon:yes stop_codon:yes gene_type:complete